MDNISKVYRHNNVRGDRVILELSMDDALAIFSDCRQGQNPVDYLIETVAERRQLSIYAQRAKWSALLFVLVLFFFRRFIP
jgi:hypothetical protein